MVDAHPVGARSRNLNNEVMNDYGLKMLGVLTKSEMAVTVKEATLDAIWPVSSTGSKTKPPGGAEARSGASVRLRQ